MASSPHNPEGEMHRARYAQALSAAMGEGTNINFDDMPAGSHLNRLVAERVMRWQASEVIPGEVHRYTTGDGTSFLANEWLPSSDRLRVLPIVDKLVSMGNDVDICVSQKFVVVKINGSEAARVAAGHTAAPLAVCRAALKAVANR